MVQIIRENRKPSTSEKVFDLMGAGLNVGAQHLMNKEKKRIEDQKNKETSEMIYKLTGKNVEGLPLDFQKEILSQSLRGENELSKLQGQQFQKQQLQGQELRGKKQEEMAPLNAGLQTLNNMKKILKKGNLGIFSAGKGVFHEETRRDRAEYSQLGKSLISLASNIPIRNQREFEVLAHDLYNPDNSDATNEGILKAMENIIKRSMQEAGFEDIEQLNHVEIEKEKPEITSFYR